MKNDYYTIAFNELLYLQHTLDTTFYNSIIIHIQQVVEKMLKSVAELVCTDIDKLLNSHNLRALYFEIHQEIPDFVLNPAELSMLKDYYFDAKYPGDNFVTVTKEECTIGLQTMYEVIDVVNKFRCDRDLDVMPINKLFLTNDGKMDLFSK